MKATIRPDKDGCLWIDIEYDDPIFDTAWATDN